MSLLLLFRGQGGPANVSGSAVSTSAASGGVVVTATTQVPLGASVSTSTAAGGVVTTAATQIPLAASASTSTASGTITAATQIPLAASVSTSTASILVTAATQIALGASASTSTAAGAITIGTSVVTLAASISTSTATLTPSTLILIPTAASVSTSAATGAVGFRGEVTTDASASTSNTALFFAAGGPHNFVVFLASTSTAAMSLTAPAMYLNLVNLIVDPNLDHDALGPAPPLFQDSGQGTAVPGVNSLTTLAVQNGWASSGTQSLRVTWTGGSASADVFPGILVSHFTPNLLPVTPGSPYYFSVDYNLLTVPLTVPDAISMDLSWYDVDRNFISNVAIGHGTVRGTGTGTITGFATPPSNAVFALIGVYHPVRVGNGTSQLVDFYLDNFMVVQSGVAVPYFDGDRAGSVWTGIIGGSVTNEPAMISGGVSTASGALGAEGLVATNEADSFSAANLNLSAAKPIAMSAAATSTGSAALSARNLLALLASVSSSTAAAVIASIAPLPTAASAGVSTDALSLMTAEQLAPGICISNSTTALASILGPLQHPDPSVAVSTASLDTFAHLRSLSAASTSKATLYILVHKHPHNIVVVQDLRRDVVVVNDPHRNLVAAPPAHQNRVARPPVVQNLYVPVEAPEDDIVVTT